MNLSIRRNSGPQANNLTPSETKKAPQLLSINEEEKTKTTLYHIFNKSSGLYHPYIRTTSTERKKETKPRRNRMDKGRARGKQRAPQKERKTRSDKGTIRVVKNGKHIKSFNCYLKRYEDKKVFETKREIVNKINPDDIRCKFSEDDLKKVKKFIMSDPTITIETSMLLFEIH